MTHHWFGRPASGTGPRPGHLSRFIIALTLAIALLMTGCSEYESAPTIDPHGDSNSIGTLRVHYEDLPDGRQVLSVYESINANSGRGVSYDRQGARPQNNSATTSSHAERGHEMTYQDSRSTRGLPAVHCAGDVNTNT